MSSEQPLSAFIQVPKSGTPGTASPVPGQVKFLIFSQSDNFRNYKSNKELN